MVGSLRAISRERLAMGSLLFAAGVACVLGAADPPPAITAGGGGEILALIRVATTTALAICLLLEPGLLARELSGRRFGLGFVPLPGLALLVLVGALAWALSGSVEPKVVCFAVLAPVLGLQQASAGFAWCRSPLPRAILALRGVEVLGLAVIPVLGTHGFDPLGSSFRLDNLVALAVIVVLSLVLVAVLWRETGRLAEELRPASR